MCDILRNELDYDDLNTSSDEHLKPHSTEPGRVTDLNEYCHVCGMVLKYGRRLIPG
jgi:hypothetical protein